ncbi:MAG TPA: hypothetical protein VFW44_12280 [Bryobacteraceae bacterium]|nr:hypothetical protein [Bryobacteraceae bacterium]
MIRVKERRAMWAIITVFTVTFLYYLPVLFMIVVCGILGKPCASP